MQKIFKNFTALIIVGALIFVFREELQNIFFQLRGRFLPCGSPISYSIGIFDERFGISRKNFLADTKQAEEIWEKPIEKDLFMEKANGSLKINLIYDYRQDVTEKLKILGISADDSRASYELVKARYVVLSEQYLKDRNIFESKVAAMESHQDAYNKKVAYWNARRGAPKVEYNALQLERESIQAEIASINQLQKDLSAEVENINALVSTLNRLAEELNIDVARFNEVGASRGEEFEEGLYKSGPKGRSIDIYQYDSKNKLIRVLAHEFGHALELEHISNPKAIMYKLNEGTNEKLTADDLSALKIRCGIK